MNTEKQGWWWRFLFANGYAPLFVHNYLQKKSQNLQKLFLRFPPSTPNPYLLVSVTSHMCVLSAPVWSEMNFWINIDNFSRMRSMEKLQLISYNRTDWCEGVLPFSYCPWKTCRLAYIARKRNHINKKHNSDKLVSECKTELNTW